MTAVSQMQPGRAPREMKTPAVDYQALHNHIANEIKKVEAADYRTRGQVNLEQARKNVTAINADLDDVRAKIAGTEKNMTDLQKMLDILRANEADLNIELNGEQVKAHALEQSGVKL
jgi:soluble cytochrome b562